MNDIRHVYMHMIHTQSFHGHVFLFLLNKYIKVGDTGDEGFMFYASAEIIYRGSTIIYSHQQNEK